MLFPTGPSQTVSKVDLAVRRQLARLSGPDISARVFGWCDRAGLPLPLPRNDRAWHCAASGRDGSVAFCGKPSQIGTVPPRMASCCSIVWMCTMPGCNSSFVSHPGGRMPVVSNVNRVQSAIHVSAGSHLPAGMFLTSCSTFHAVQWPTLTYTSLPPVTGELRIKSNTHKMSQVCDGRTRSTALDSAASRRLL